MIFLNRKMYNLLVTNYPDKENKSSQINPVCLIPIILVLPTIPSDPKICKEKLMI